MGQQRETESPLGDKDIEAINSFKDMLSFYGVELQSHASLVLGLGLLIFAVIQAWGQLASASRLPDLHAVLFSSVVGVIIAGITYQLLRLYTFGKLASALMYASEEAFKTCKKHYIENRYAPPWENLVPLARISAFSTWFFRKYARLSRGFIDSRLHVRPWVLLASFGLSFFASWGLMFGDFRKWNALFLGDFAVWYLIPIAVGPLILYLLGAALLKTLKTLKHFRKLKSSP